MVQQALGTDMIESKDGNKGLVKSKYSKPIDLDLIFNIPSILPVEGVLTQKMVEKFDDFSNQHLGIDIAVPEQSPILASASGQVIFSGMTENLGNLVVLFHGNEYFTYYGHNASIEAKLHEFVNIGDTIARSGNTGESSGPHLHFEIWKNGEAINPLTYFPNYNKSNMSVE
jgi:murein DD-endopeptidase MepM/ murein hydrolase activator NlpD